MAIGFLSHVVADLALGKPALSFLPSSASVRDALRWLRHDHISEISVWACSHRHGAEQGVRSPTSASAGLKCVCIGKVSMLHIICYLARDENLRNPSRALRDPISTLLLGSDCTVHHIDPNASLLEVLELIVIRGAQNLVVPITGRAAHRIRDVTEEAHGIDDEHVKAPRSVAGTRTTPITLPRHHDGKEYCWLTREDVLRFMLGSIAIFSPLPVTSIRDLNIIRTDMKTIGFEEDAAMAVDMIELSGHHMAPIAVVDRAHDNDNGAVKLVGDISCCSLQGCNETAALALATLSAGDFFIYTQDCKNPPDVLVELIRLKVFEKMRAGLTNGGELKHGLTNGEESKHGLTNGEESKHGLTNGEELKHGLTNGEESKHGLTNGEESRHGVAAHLRHDLEMWEDLSSSDDESGAYSPTGPHELSQKWHYRSFKVGSGAKNRSGPIFCNPRSSLVAVLLQALSHREHYVWVTGEDDTLVGFVTTLDILRVMLNHINAYRT